MVGVKAFYHQIIATYTKAQLGFVVMCTILIPVGIIYAVMVVSSRSTSEIPFVDELDIIYGPVIHVNLLYRHGERTIDILLPLDPYGHAAYWPEGLGQLTKKGILHHHNLGRWLATRYAHLLPTDYKNLHNAISVKSTDFDRTIMSAQAQLAGMFQFKQDAEDWNGLGHFPVPVHSVPEDEDNFLDISKKCDRYDILMNETKSTKPYRDVMMKYENIIQLVKENYGYDIVDMHGFQKIYGVLQIEEDRGLILPEWVSQIYPSPLIEPTITSFKAPTWYDSLKRLKGGPTVKMFLKNFQDKLSDGNFRNISSYSGHDTSIAQFLDSMNIFNDEHPPMAGMVLMELRRMNKTAVPIVTIYYKNSTSEPFPLVLPNCAHGCPLEQMEAILKPIIPENWEQECSESSSNSI